MGQVSLLQYHTPHAKPPCLIRRGEGGVHDTCVHDTRARVLLTLSCVCVSRRACVVCCEFGLALCGSTRMADADAAPWHAMNCYLYPCTHYRWYVFGQSIPDVVCIYVQCVYEYTVYVCELT